MGTVDDYLATLDPLDGEVIGRLYAVAQDEVPEAEQGTSYAMPALIYRGKGLLALMRTSKHIGLYPFSGSLLPLVAASLGGLDWDKGTLRFQTDAPPPDDLVREIVRLRRAQIET